MSFIGNVLWIILGGFVVAIGYIFGGLVLLVTIIGIPFGLQSIKYGLISLTPFGKEVVDSEGGSSLKVVFDVIWIILFGWEIALAHLILGVIFGITIIGIPFAKQHFKLISIALFPFSKDLREPSQ